VTSKLKYRYRSAITGRFVTREYALRNPNTTIREAIKCEQSSE